MGYKIITEGVWDRAFMQAYLKSLFGEDFVNTEIRFVQNGGYTNLAKNKPQFDETTDAGGKNIVVFDTDFTETGGGLVARSRYLLSEKARLSLTFELFLFPNNRDEGEFENLLEGIVKPIHADVINCFNGFENCIKQLTIKNVALKYNAPLQKSKIFAYVDTVANPDEFEEEKKVKSMCYSNPNYWDFNSAAIAPLREFLLNQIIP